MPRPKKTTLVSFQHAFDGIFHVLRTRRLARLFAAFSIAVLAAGARVSLTREQWFMVYVAIALVFVALMISTSVEACVDLFVEQHSPHAGHAARIASGATLAATILAVALIALVFLSPPL